MKIFQNLNRMFILPGTCPVYVQKSPNLCVWCKEPAWTWIKTCEEWTLTPSLLWRKREHGVRRYGCQQTRLNSVLWVRECICSVVGVNAARCTSEQLLHEVMFEVMILFFTGRGATARESSGVYWASEQVWRWKNWSYGQVSNWLHLLIGNLDYQNKFGYGISSRRG